MSASFDRLTAALADRYRLERELGQGGMATVYLAEDLKHHRRVAIKVLRPELAGVLGPERFLREIEIAAGLHHPHILPLYDSGEAHPERSEGPQGSDGPSVLFYVMPYVEGHSLRDRLARERQLPIEDALRIAREVADALSYAHTQGVVHRDIKPENILLDAGHAVVTDFGIARAVTAAGGDALTATGIVLGTSAYMSPEQATGSQELDGRSDLYSLACVLYEMLAGQPPFTGPTAGTVVHQHMTADPPPITRLRPAVSAELAGTLARALAKNPADRFNPVAQFADALAPRWSSATGASAGRAQESVPSRRPAAVRLAAIAIAAAVVLGGGYWLLSRGRPEASAAGSGTPRVVVLPFTNLGAADDQYFADGVTDEITSRTGQLPGLEVIARSSAAQYKGTDRNVYQIGKELGVQYVLEGSVRWQRGSNGPGRVRVTPELIRVSDGTQLWTERYDAVLADIFQVQSDIAKEIAGALGLALQRPDSTAAAAPTSNLEAYDYYLRGNEYYNRGTAAADHKSAVQMYQQALERDGRFAQAYARLAMAHLVIYWFRHDINPDRLVAAKTALDRAVALQPGSPEVEMAQGYYAYWGRRDYAAALEHFRNTLRSRPSDSEVIFGIAAVERRQGKFEQALADFTRALELDPRNVERTRAVAETYGVLRRFAEGEQHFDRAIALAPDQADSYWQKSALYQRWRGDTKAARATLEEALAQGARDRDHLLFSLVTVDEFEGKYRDALARLATIPTEVWAIQLATVPKAQYFADLHALMGHPEIARAYEDSAVAALQARLQKDPDDASLRGALGIAYAGLGRREDAIREGERAVELLPMSKDAWAGTYRALELARIYMMVGDQNAAIERLEYLLSIPSDVTAVLLRLDPTWTPLRSSPRFVKLVGAAK